MNNLSRVRAYIQPEDLWDYCKKNSERLVESADMIAVAGDGEDKVWLFVTRDFDNEDDDNCYMLSLEDLNCVIDSEVFCSGEDAAKSMRAFIKRIEEGVV